jgi:hypothetical protein
VGGVGQANISSWAKPGQVNQLEIWPFSAVPIEYQLVSKSKITLEKVTLGVVTSH